MKKTKKAITTILACTMCITSLIPTYASASSQRNTNDRSISALSATRTNYTVVGNEFCQTNYTINIMKDSLYQNGMVSQLKRYFPENTLWTQTVNGFRDILSDFNVSGTSPSQSGNNTYGYSQCFSFGVQMSAEICGTDLFRKFSMSDLSNNYVPKIGDHVRIDGNHSIVITDSYSSTVEYVDCNANGDLRVHWDKTMTKTALRQRFNFVYRPIKMGDVNGDDVVNNADLTMLQQMVFGNKTNGWYTLRNFVGDMDGNGILEITDMTKLSLCLNGGVNYNQSYGYAASNVPCLTFYMPENQ